MSTGKYDEVSLREQRRRELEAERRRKLEEERRKVEQQIRDAMRKKEEEERRKKLALLENQLDEVDLNLELVKTDIDLFEKATLEEFSRFKSEASVYKRVIELKTEFAAHISTLSPRPMPENIESLRTWLNEKKRLLKVMMNGIERLNEMKEPLHLELKGIRIKTAEDNFVLNSAKMQVEKKQVYSFDQEKEIIEKYDLQSEIDAFRESLESYRDNPFFNRHEEFDTLVTGLKRMASNTVLTEEDRFKQIRQSIVTFEAGKSIYESHIEDQKQGWRRYGQVVMEYLAYCAQLELEADTRWQQLSLSEFNFVQLVQLEKVNADLALQLQKQEEEEYIKNAVDEVMRELVGEAAYLDLVKLADQDGQPINAEQIIYQFQNDHAVNVLVSEDGSRLFFEPVGIADGRKNPSESESALIALTMQAFCELYPSIREKLEERGLMLRLLRSEEADPSLAKYIDVSNKERIADSSEISQQNIAESTKTRRRRRSQSSRRRASRE
jgi:hypothetical protein